MRGHSERFINKSSSERFNDLAVRIAKRVLIVHASEGGSLQSQVEIWKSDGLQFEHLGRMKCIK